MRNECYWKGYQKFWDDFVKEWFTRRHLGEDPQDEVSQAYKTCVKGLEFDELPEPYYGAPYAGSTVKAVVINLNPGISATVEGQKFYKEKDTYCGKGPFVKKSLVKEFEVSCNERYSEFVETWSCLKSKFRVRNTDLCGVKWWQGVDPKKIGGKRLAWLSRIYQDVELKPEDVFALECCPYHSFGFSFNCRDEKSVLILQKFIKENVIIPAATAVAENKLPFAVGIGKTIADILDSVIGKPSKEWSYNSPSGWSKDLPKRTYKLYEAHVSNDRIVPIVVTWAVNNRGVPAPGKVFGSVEKDIYDYCKDKFQIA
jgi:hypothetical protein